MASDLSLLIEETICSTLETNLSKSTTISNVLNVTQNKLKDLNLISIDTSFTFDKITIKLKFILPAYISSFIFNIMMFEDNEPSLEVNDDIADAIKEIFSQVSGGLETAINGSAFEDLGTTKFSIGDFQIIKGNDYLITHKLILFKLAIENKKFDMFIDFEESALEYLSKINSAETIEIEEEIESQEDSSENKTEDNENSSENEIKNQEEPLEEEIENKKENTQNEETEKQKNNTPKEEKENKEESSKEKQEYNEDIIPKDAEDQNIDDSKEEPNEEDKKHKKIKLLIIIIGGILVTILIAFTVSYFMGIFNEPEPIIIKDINKTIIPKQKIIITEIKNKQIDFKLEMINKDRLNRRLKFLTKYDIMEEDALEKFRLKEKDRLYKFKMKRLEEFAANNKEESLFKKSISGKTISNKDRFSIDSNNTLSREEQTILENEKLTFIQISSLKYKKYKDIIKKEKTKNISISICKNSKDKIDVYIGPIYIKTIVNNIINKIKNNSDAKIVTLTRKEFDKRCDF
ncbi:MAG: hypothetical protein KAJ49_02995 [Arcobacteraceae bacterium]|nr:hypothetical protein [Arcobacteraceae bacterium]